jgi:hypothetical protein
MHGHVLFGWCFVTGQVLRDELMCLKDSNQEAHAASGDGHLGTAWSHL